MDCHGTKQQGGRGEMANKARRLCTELIFAVRTLNHRHHQLNRQNGGWLCWFLQTTDVLKLCVAVWQSFLVTTLLIWLGLGTKNS